MEDFNLDDAQAFLDTRDYLGYAEYLKKFKASDFRKQELLNQRIDKYTKLGNIQQSILEEIDDESKQAYNFINGMSGIGTIPNKKNSDNQFGINYINNISNLQDNNGNKINKINIIYKKENNFLNLLNELNCTKEELYDKYGISYSNNTNDGSINLYIETDNKKLPLILRNANIAIEKANESIKTNLAIQNKLTGVDIDFNNPISAELATPSPYIVNTYDIQGITENGIIVNKRNFNYDNLINAVRIYDNAKKRYDDILKNVKSENYDEQLHTTMFLGDGHRRMYEAWQKGGIKTTDYNAFVKAKTEQYNTLLKQTDLTQYRMFAAGIDDDKDFVLKEIDNPTRLEAMKHISAAMEDNRVTYSAGMVGGQLGTVITIAQDYNKDKELEKKEGGRLMRFFVPELFTKSAQESFNATSQGAAIVENSDMKRWNYGKTLHDGTKIGYNKQIGPYTTITNENGITQKVSVDENYIINALNQEEIITRNVNKLYSLFDREGNISGELLNGKSQQDFLNSVINSLATASMDELYPKEQYTTNERLFERDRLYRVIYKMLNERLNK